MPALRRELDSLLAQGINEEVHHAPSNCCSAKKEHNGHLNVHRPPKTTKVNKYVIRPTNPQLTAWEIIRDIPKGTKHYAVFDALKGYHQIELDEESRALTTFMTPFGRFLYIRLPFGLSCGDVFILAYGNAIDASIDGRRATEDTLIRGDTEEELLENT